MTNTVEGFMQQAKKAKENVQKAQDELSKETVIGQAGAGMVQITANGQGEVLEIHIDDSVYDGDKQVLKGLLIAAMNDIKSKCEEVKSKKMQSMLGEIGLPANFMSSFIKS